MKKLSKPAFLKVFPWVLVIGGIIGLIASSVLTVEKIKIAADPNFIPSCSISPIVACSPVISSDQATAFGVPNPFLGLAGFGMVIAVGMMLFAGATDLKKWFWWCFQAGTLFGILFVSWLIYQSVYEIGKLCLYCMATWAITIPIFWTTTAYNLQQKNLTVRGALGTVLRNHSGKLVVLSYVIVLIIVSTHFSEYWYSLL
jgi:uncharacterized membrane protein